MPLNRGLISKIKLGPAKLTRYELARIIGARALQIALGAPVLIQVPPGVTDPITIATLEVRSGVVPFIIRRRVGKRYQDIPVKVLLEAEKEYLLSDP